MSFIVQISPFVHLFTLKIIFRWGLSPLNPHQGSAPDLVGGAKWPQNPRRKLCLHLILYLATPLHTLMYVVRVHFKLVRDSSAVRRLFVRRAGAVGRQSALHK